MTHLSHQSNLVQKIILFLLLTCIIAYLLVFAFANFIGFKPFCNSDAYSECQVAIRMWEQKTIFPQGWTFCNQFYVIATPVLAAGVYGLTGNILFAMSLATQIMTILILLSFIWMLRGLGCKILQQLFACLLLMASMVTPWGPASMNSLLFFTQSSFYASYLITLFFVFGDYARCLTSTKTRLVSWIISLILCFVTGMQSLRQLVIAILPIFAYEAFFVIRSILRKEKFLNQKFRTRILRAVSYAAVNLLGAAYIKWLDVPISPIYGSVQLSDSSGLSQKLSSIVSAFLEITSLDYLVQGDYSRLIALVIFFMIGIGLVGGLIWLFRIYRPEDPLELCWILCLIGILGVLLATLVLDVTLRSIYIFMWFPLVALSGVLILRKLPRLGQYAWIVLVCAVSIVSLVYCYQPSLNRILERENLAEAQLSQWAVDNGYEYIYGEYWGTAPQIAVYSQGKLDAGCWHGAENVYQVELANTPQDIYSAAENEKALYVFTSEDVQNGLQYAQEKGVSMELKVQFGDFRAYTASQPLMYSNN